MTAIISDTVEAARRYTGGPVRFLLIDADHSFSGVRRDFLAWAPKVPLGGRIVFHDYHMPEAGVARFVDECVATDPCFKMAPGLIAPNVMAVTRRMTVPNEADRRHVSAPIHPAPAIGETVR